MIPYTKNIEQVILDYFEKSKKSIVIVVAWFTNKKIVERLIQLKRRNESLSIKILVDENEVNQKYFFNLYYERLIEAGIEIKRQKIAKFNHNKFSIIDEEIIITGSYNYTQRANTNHENIIVDTNKRIAKYYTRVFRFFTEKKYIDENIEILFDNFNFANELISSYYPFSRKLFSKIKNKITLGFCFTHENGFYNEISYEPGLIFNPKFKLHMQLNNIIKRQKSNEISMELIESDLTQEFPLPISKDTILSYKISSFQDYQYSSHQDIAIANKNDIDYEELSKDFEKTELALTKYYTIKFQNSFSKLELKKILKGNIDIIIEDYIWINNFAPFLSDEIVAEIYRKNLK
jgi:hypothetical protein